MAKSNILVNYRYVEDMSIQEKHDLDQQIQLEFSKIMNKLVDENKISVFHTNDNEWVARIVRDEYYGPLLCELKRGN